MLLILNGDTNSRIVSRNPPSMIAIYFSLRGLFREEITNRHFFSPNVV